METSRFVKASNPKHIRGRDREQPLGAVDGFAGSYCVGGSEAGFGSAPAFASSSVRRARPSMRRDHFASLSRTASRLRPARAMASISVGGESCHQRPTSTISRPNSPFAARRRRCGRRAEPIA